MTDANDDIEKAYDEVVNIARQSYTNELIKLQTYWAAQEEKMASDDEDYIPVDNAIWDNGYLRKGVARVELKNNAFIIADVNTGKTTGRKQTKGSGWLGMVEGAVFIGVFKERANGDRYSQGFLTLPEGIKEVGEFGEYIEELDGETKK